MALSLRKQNNIYLIGGVDFNIMGSKLPSNRQVLSVFFYNTRMVKLNTRKSASLVVREVLIFWEKARIPTKQNQHCLSKVLKLYNEWRYLQKNKKKSGIVFRERENVFKNNLDNLFDVAHANALSMVDIEEDRQFLIAQRRPGRIGGMGSADFIYTEVEKKREKRKQEELNRQQHHLATKIAENSCQNCFEDVSDAEDEDINELTSISPNQQSPVIKRSTKHFITPKLVAVLDRCHVSARNSVFILQAVAEALGHNLGDLIITKTSIQQQREKLRCERAENIKAKFKEWVQPFLVIHWDGKLLPALSVNEKAVERLPIIVTGFETEQILEIPKLNNASGEAQAIAVFNALEKWELSDKINALCCDTTASNTGRLNGACVLLEKKLGRDLLYLPCRHHIYELILKAVFEKKLPDITTSPDVPFFKKFKNCWNKLNPKNITYGMENERCRHILQPIAEEMIKFVSKELSKTQVREDYREFLELTLYFISGDKEKTVTIRPPGAMHQARWMSRAIYCLKIYLLRKQYSIPADQEHALADVCIFIIKFYVKAWFECPMASEASVNDLNFLKALTLYEKNDPVTSEAAIKKLCNHLWYLVEETSALAFFDERLNASTRRNMVKALNTRAKLDAKKKLMINHENIKALTGKISNDILCTSTDFFITSGSMNFFSRFNIDSTFLKEDPERTEHEESFINGKNLLQKLKVVNDTAERAVKLVEAYHGLLTKMKVRWLILCNVFMSIENFTLIVQNTH